MSLFQIPEDIPNDYYHSMDLYLWILVVILFELIALRYYF